MYNILTGKNVHMDSISRALYKVSKEVFKHECDYKAAN